MIVRYLRNMEKMEGNLFLFVVDMLKEKLFMGIFDETRIPTIGAMLCGVTVGELKAKEKAFHNILRTICHVQI